MGYAPLQSLGGFSLAAFLGEGGGGESGSIKMVAVAWVYV